MSRRLTMSITLTTYREKAADVSAVQLTRDNARDVALWAEGQVISLVDPRTMESFDGVEISPPYGPGPVRVAVGEYVLRDSDGKFHRLAADEFQSRFEAVSR